MPADSYPGKRVAACCDRLNEGVDLMCQRAASWSLQPSSPVSWDFGDCFSALKAEQISPPPHPQVALLYVKMANHWSSPFMSLSCLYAPPSLLSAAVVSAACMASVSRTQFAAAVSVSGGSSASWEVLALLL